LRDRSIKTKVWGLKARDPAIFHDFFHMEAMVIYIFLNSLPPGFWFKNSWETIFQNEKILKID
jgi:hypothetical protein